MKGSRKHLVKPARSIGADARALQLKAAKQILAEVFHAQLGDVEDMIIIRLAEKKRNEEKYQQEFKVEENGRACKNERARENEDHSRWGTWPEMFWLEEAKKSCADRFMR
jgi:ABC-type Zn2+ transport system substrate-binding protein/surface adhesin